MAEHVHVHFVAEVVGADGVEEVRPLVIELKVVDFRIAMEQAAVVAHIEPEEVGVPLVNGVEQVEEVAPSRVGDFAEGGERLVGPINAPGRQQAAVLAEGDEDDPVEESLGDVDRAVQVFAVLPRHQMLDEPEPVVAVLLVQLVPDLALAILGQLKEVQRAKGLPERGPHQPAPLEKEIELPELVHVAEFLEAELLVGARSLVAVIEPKRDEVADDSPRAVGQGVQVVPALLHRSPAVEAVLVEIDPRPFELDDDQRRGSLAGLEIAQGGVGGSSAGHREVALQFVFVGALGRLPVRERVAEHLLEEAGVHGRLLPGEVAGPLQIGPAFEDFVGAVLRLAAVEDLVGLVGEETGQDQPGAPAALDRREKVVGDSAGGWLLALSHAGGLLSHWRRSEKPA